MHSSTLIGKTIPHQVGPVERLEYPGGVHVKPKYVDYLDYLDYTAIPASWIPFVEFNKHSWQVWAEDTDSYCGGIPDSNLGKIIDKTI